MKKLVVIISIFMLVLNVSITKAQVSLNINLGSQPVWGPTGYDHVDYYYLPDVESYYNVPKHQYVYKNGGQWVFGDRLPSQYANYDVNRGYKVVLNEPKPYLHFENDKVKYLQYKGYKHQDFIMNSDNPKYYVVKGHPKYNGNNKYGNKHDGTFGHENNGHGKGNKGKGNKGKDDDDDDHDNGKNNGKSKGKGHDKD